MSIFSDHITKWFESLNHTQRKDLLQDLHSLKFTVSRYPERKVLIEGLINELEDMHEKIKRLKGLP
jgi:hypothetical protein